MCGQNQVFISALCVQNNAKMISLDLWRARIGLFGRVRSTKCVRVLGITGLGIRLIAATLIVICILLQLAGDIELNPGPTNMNDNSDKGAVSNEEILADIRLILREQTELRETIEEKFRSMENKLADRLQDIEDTVDRTNSEVVRLSESVEVLSEENERLREEIVKQSEKMNRQDEKLDYLENQSRRQNLMFYNIPKEKANETWEDCEILVRKVIKDFLQIHTEVLIDRAHRIGKQIIVRFQNFKDKDLVLRNAHKLKDQSASTKIGISEDFSRAVRGKRKELMGMKHRYKTSNQRANLVYDKLYTPDGVFTYDPETREIKKLQDAQYKYKNTENQVGLRRNSPMRTREFDEDWPVIQSARGGTEVNSEVNQSARRETQSGRDGVTLNHSILGRRHDRDDADERQRRPVTRLFAKQDVATHPQQDEGNGEYQDQGDMGRLRGFGRGTTPPNAQHQDTGAGGYASNSFTAGESLYVPTSASRRGARGRGTPPSRLHHGGTTRGK